MHKALASDAGRLATSFPWRPIWPRTHGMLHEGARDRNCFDFIRKDKIRDISERRLIKILASQGESMSILSLTELVMKSFSIAKKHLCESPGRREKGAVNRSIRASAVTTGPTGNTIRSSPLDMLFTSEAESQRVFCNSGCQLMFFGGNYCCL